MTDDEATVDVLIAACAGLTYGNGAPLVGYPFGSLPEMARIVTAALRQRTERAEASLQACHDDFMNLDRKATAVFELSDQKQRQWEERAERVEAERDALLADNQRLRAALAATPPGDGGG